MVAMSKTRRPVVRYRHHPGRAVAGLIAALGLTTLLAVSGWFALLLVPPLAWTVWVLRAGTDVGPDGLRVRALLASRTVPWSQVESLSADRSGGVVATLTSGGALPLTAVPAADLHRLTQTSVDEAPNAAANGANRP